MSLGKVLYVVVFMTFLKTNGSIFSFGKKIKKYIKPNAQANPSYRSIEPWLRGDKHIKERNKKLFESSINTIVKST